MSNIKDVMEKALAKALEADSDRAAGKKSALDDLFNYAEDQPAPDPRTLMEQGLVAAINSLKEVLIYAEYGRTDGIKNEVNSALEFIDSLGIEFQQVEVEEVSDSPEMKITIVTDDE